MAISAETVDAFLPSPNMDQDTHVIENDGQPIVETQDYDSVVSTNGGQSSISSHSPTDGTCLVPVSVIPGEAQLGDYDDRMQLESKQGANPNRLLYGCPNNRFLHSCNCNRFFSPYLQCRSKWTGPCGPQCGLLYSGSRVYGPCQPLGERWRNRENGENLPCWPSVLETVPTGVGAGLNNLGNTCFINAILQCFTHTVPLVKALRSCNHLMPCKRGIEQFCALCALRDHVELSLTSSGKAISPSKVVENLKHISSCFEKYQQEDAHEFLQCLLDKLERCCLAPDIMSDDTSSSGEDNIVERVFGGRLVSKLQCCNCGHFSDKYEPLIDLSLEIEDVETLQSALESFTKVERIEDDTKFICEHCKEETWREKQLILDQAPCVAALHLKRFKSEGSFIEKIDKHVEFPLELDLKPFKNCAQDSNQNQVDLKYQLYAFVVHNGLLPTSGHYFCYVRSSPVTWHQLDDTRVVKVEEERVLSEAAYILFYVRNGTPWFSSLMEQQKDCLDPSISKASPKSVLDRGVTESAPYPRFPNFDHSKTCLTRGKVELERASSQLSCVKVVEKHLLSETGNDCERNSTPIIYGSPQSGDELYCDESRSETLKHEVSMPLEPMVCHDGNLNDENLGSLSCVQENNCGQDTDVAGRNDVEPAISAEPSGPVFSSTGLQESRNHSRRSHLKVEHPINFKKPKKKDQRVEALRYINKNLPSARGSRLIAAMLPQNDKKRRSGSSPCKQGPPPGSRPTMHRRSAVLR